MTGLLQRLLPREEGFFGLLAKQAANIHEGANALLKMPEHYTGVPEQVQIVKAFEHEGDRPQPAPIESRPLVPQIAAFFRRSFQPGPRDQRLTKRHGHDHRRTCL